jgi:hypothetical protein
MEYSKFRVHPKSFSKDRPLGVSGFLRVKNDAEFLNASIESCLPALDELIIVYNDCSDNSPEIINNIAKQYPCKIKVFEYQPKIYSHNLSKEEYEFISSEDQFSPHLLSSYYNFALSKTSYKYAIKIDADQIYDTCELIKICSAYRNSTKQFINPLKFIVFIYVFIAILLYKKGKVKLPFISKKIFKLYNEVLIQLIINYKVSVFFSGINMIYIDGQWITPLGLKTDTGLNILPPYNGLTDHPIFPVSEKIYFAPIEMESYNRLNTLSYTIIEHFVGLPRCFPYGFIWVHLNACRKLLIEKSVNNYKRFPDRFIESRKFICSIASELSISDNHDIISSQNRNFYSFIHDYMDHRYFEEYISKYSIIDGVLIKDNK